MKLKVENTKLKILINEATYNDAFTQIKKGDTLIVKSGKQVYKSNVINKFSNQITFEWDGEYYIITNNSYDGNNLDTMRIILGNDGRQKRTVKGPTIKGVYNIIVKRGNKIITGVTSDNGRPKDLENKQNDSKVEFEHRRNDIFNEFNKLNIGDVIEITTGKIISKGSDSGSLAKNSITTIRLKSEGITGKWIKLSPVDFSGKEASKYKDYDNTYFFIDIGSIKTTKEGIILIPITKNLNDGKTGKLQIKNVFGVENIGQHSTEPDYTVADIMKSPSMRKMMMKNPSLLDKILGRNKSKGIVPLDNKLSSIGLSSTQKKGKRVKYQYIGVDIRPDKAFNFKNENIYIGKFSKQNVIRRTGDNRRESMYLTLGHKNEDGTYHVTIDYVKTVNNEPQREQIGNGKIKIIELIN